MDNIFCFGSKMHHRSNMAAVWSTLNIYSQWNNLYLFFSESAYTVCVQTIIDLTEIWATTEGQRYHSNNIRCILVFLETLRSRAVIGRLFFGCHWGNRMMGILTHERKQ